jgi:hypothetical protein
MGQAVSTGTLTSARVRQAADALFNHWLRVVELGLRNRSPDVYETAIAARDRLLADIQGDRTTVKLLNLRLGPWRGIRSFFRMPEIDPQRAQRAAVEHIAGRIQDNESRLLRLIEVIQRHGGKALPKQDEPGATPERLAKPRQRDSVERLYELGHLTDQDLQAARSIARIFEASSRAAFAKIGRMESAGRAPEGAWLDPLMTMRADDALLHAGVYKPWTEDIRRLDPRRMDWLLDLIVYGRSVKEIAGRERKAWATIVDLLKDALWRYRDRLSRHRARASRM